MSVKCKMALIYLYAAVQGTLVGVAVAMIFGLWGVPIALGMGICGVWSAKTACEIDKEERR